MLMIGIVWVNIAAMFLVAHATSWAMEKTAFEVISARFPSQGLNAHERVMDSPGVTGARGNDAYTVQRLNDILLRRSQADLKEPGIATSPKAGEVVAPERQRIDLPMGRIQ